MYARLSSQWRRSADAQVRMREQRRLTVGGEERDVEVGFGGGEEKTGRGVAGDRQRGSGCEIAREPGRGCGFVPLDGLSKHLRLAAGAHHKRCSSPPLDTFFASISPPLLCHCSAQPPFAAQQHQYYTNPRITVSAEPQDNRKAEDASWSTSLGYDTAAAFRTGSS
ncbi:uncharacterized protein BKA78DRAFT_50968 [Phyllosticta capitalensis]|uniref:uncharacterized protein n=1 Tax=Phyllosticta capitalensis TaxID=121624 RepID=UPI00312CD1FB